MLRVRVFLTLSRNVSKRLETRPLLCCFSTLGTHLDRWQRRCDRLAQLQRKIRFPPLQNLAVRGQTYKLPLPPVEPVRTPTREELEYLVGFFDGDGCVSMKKQTGEVQLVIGQNVDSAEVLLRFRSLLGGSIGRHSASTGSQKAMVQWRIYGSKMAAAAETLSRVPSMKQAQLLIAMRGKVGMDDRAKVGEQLQRFKDRLHVADQVADSSWGYLSGFFDAEGCLHVHPFHASLRMEIIQVNPCMLLHLVRFLHDNQLTTWSLHHYASYSTLSCTDFRDCMQTLQLLLAHGLLVKRKQAELALSLTAENHRQIRDAISSLNGLQGRYQRLDTDGVARAREIQTVQKRLQRLDGPEHAALLSQLQELRAEHKLQKLISQCHLLRKDMRQSLRQGGEVISATNCSS